MIIILFLLYILALPFYVFSSGREKHSNYIPISTLGTILLMYIALFLDRVSWGFYCAVLFIIALYIRSFRNLSRHPGRKMQDFFSTGIISYILVLGTIYLFTINSYVSLWDELRLWGAVPRYLYYSDTTFIGLDSIIYTDMQNYPPAMQLFQYFVMKLNFSYADNILFFAYAALSAGLFIPALSNQKKSLWLLPLYILIIVFIPQAYANSPEFDSNYYYTTLFIDPFIGILIAFILFQIVKNPFENAQKTTLYGLSLFTLTMTKEAGLLYALPIAIFGTLISLKYIVKNKKYTSCIVLLIPIAAYVSYRILLQSHGVYEPSSIHLKAIIDLFSAPTEEQANIIQEYLRLLNSKILVIQGNAFNLFGAEDFITPKIALIINILFLTIAGFFVNKNKRITMIATSAFSVLFVALVYFSLLPIYVFEIGHADYEFPSFQRYFSIPLIAQMIFSMMVISSYVDRKKIIFRTAILSAVLGICYLIFPLGLPKETGYNWARTEAESQYKIISEGIEENNKKLFLIMNNSEGEDILLHHQLYYLLIDRMINVDNTMFEIDWISNIDPKNLAMQLQKYDYLYLYADYEMLFEQNYSDLFEESISDKTLFIINKKNNRVSLKPVQKK